MCTYNGAAFLQEQLDSFAAQTKLPDELIVCDDCSQDTTRSILNDFAAVAPFPVRLFVNEKNLRSVKNFEKAISLCNGDIVFLSDQDDVWMPNKVERIVAEFDQSEKVGMVFSNAELVDENLAPFGKTLWDYSFDESLRRRARHQRLLELIVERNMVTGATMAFRARFRDFFNPIPSNNENFIHDGWIALLIASQAEVVFLDELLIKYRQHSRQQIGARILESLTENNFSANSSSLEKKFSDDTRQKALVYYQTKKESLALVEQALIEKTCGDEALKLVLAELLQLVALEKENTEKANRHFETRTNLPLAKHRRAYFIARELVAGKYHKFGRGFASAAKDLIKD